MRRRLLELDPVRPEWLWELALILWRLGDTLEQLGEIDRALAAYRELGEVAMQWLDRFTEPEPWRKDMERAKALAGEKIAALSISTPAP